VLQSDRCYLLVDLRTAESLIALKSVGLWSMQFNVPLTVLPFIKPPLNTAKDVPKGAADLEAYKALRSEARRRVRHMELQRDMQRLELATMEGLDASQWQQLNSALLHTKDNPLAPMALFSALHGCFVAATKAERDSARQALSVLLKAHYPLYGERFGPAVQAELTSLSDLLESEGVLSSPSIWFQGEVYRGAAHLPLLSAGASALQRSEW